jgi:hypothetical protein
MSAMTDHIATHHFQHPHVQPLVGSRWTDSYKPQIAASVRVIARHGAIVDLQPDDTVGDGWVLAATIADLGSRYSPAQETAW